MGSEKKEVEEELKRTQMEFLHELQEKGEKLRSLRGLSSKSTFLNPDLGLLRG